MFKIKNKGSRTNINVVITFSVVITNKFHPFFLCSVVTSEHVFVCKNSWCIHGGIRERSLLYLHGMYTYLYTYMYIYINYKHIYIYIYIYISCVSIVDFEHILVFSLLPYNLSSAIPPTYFYQTLC